MKHLSAAKQGAQAFLDGKGKAPALNKSFTDTLFKDRTNKEVIEMMDSYTSGWTYAMLASEVTDDYPSKKMFDYIMQS